MEGRIVTTEQAEQLQGVFIDADTFFNFAGSCLGIKSNVNKISNLLRDFQIKKYSTT